MLKKTHILSE